MQEWSFDWWDVSCILGAMTVSILISLRLPQILAGISEIDEVSPASPGVDVSTTPSPYAYNKAKPRSRRRRSSSGESANQQGSNDTVADSNRHNTQEEDVNEPHKLYGSDNNNTTFTKVEDGRAKNVGYQNVSLRNSSATTTHHRSSQGCDVAPVRDSSPRSPGRPRSATTSSCAALGYSKSSSLAFSSTAGYDATPINIGSCGAGVGSSGGSGPSSTCSSPRHPAGHPVRQRRPGHPRRSMSLPNGGLSYGGDVKILYQDGHFVAVVEPRLAEKPPLRREGEENDKMAETKSLSNSASSSPRRPSGYSSVISGPEMSEQPPRSAQVLNKGNTDKDALISANMRAEILSLLERGITDPNRILEEACLRSLERINTAAFSSPAAAAAVAPSSSEPLVTAAVTDTCTAQSPSGNLIEDNICSSSSSSGKSKSQFEDKTPVPLFHSLPRRKGGGKCRPVSVDEAQLQKYQSKSHQSLFNQGELDGRCLNGSTEWLKGGSGVKRNKSFNEAMGSQVDLSKLKDGNNDVKSSSKGSIFQRSLSVADTGRASKGPGFIQRMLQKRKNSLVDKTSPSLITSKEDLRGSTVSLPQSPIIVNDSQLMPPPQTSTVKTSAARERDSSIGRRMSLRTIFKRKNSSSDCAAALNEADCVDTAASSLSNNGGSPPLATFLHNDDIGALHSPPSTPSTAVQRRLPQRADNGEPYTVPPDDDDLDPLSMSYPTRSRSSRAGLHSSASSLALLARSASHENGSRGVSDTGRLQESPNNNDFVTPRRGRSSSEQGRAPGESSHHPRHLAPCSDESHLSPSSPSSPSSSVSSPTSSRIAHNHNVSWSSSDLDIALSSEDAATPTPTSPDSVRRLGCINSHYLSSPSTPVAVTPGDLSFDSVSEGDETLVATSPSDNLLGGRLSPPVYQTLTSSSQGARRRLQQEEGVHHVVIDGSTGAVLEEGSSVPDTSREITSSNSNDSGIQKDANVNSSAESITAVVRLRQTSKSPSPSSGASSRRSSAYGGSERPKSDTTVHWADLLEQVMGVVSGSASYSSSVRRRHEAGRMRRKPRPKSDIVRATERLGLETTRFAFTMMGSALDLAGSRIPECREADFLSVTNSLTNLSTTSATDDNNDNHLNQQHLPKSSTHRLNNNHNNSNSSSCRSVHSADNGSNTTLSPSNSTVDNFHSRNNSSTTTSRNTHFLRSNNASCVSLGGRGGSDSLASLVEYRVPRPHTAVFLSSSSLSSPAGISSSSSSCVNRDALLVAKLAKFRRLSTPQPITLRVDKPRPPSSTAAATSSSSTIPSTTPTNNSCGDANNTSTTCPSSPSHTINTPHTSPSGLDTVVSSPTTTTADSSLLSSSSLLSTAASQQQKQLPSSSHSSYMLSSVCGNRPAWGSGRLTHAHSMPDNLDKLTRKRHFFSRLGLEGTNRMSHPHYSMLGGADDDEDDESSDESEYSFTEGGGYSRDKSRSARSSHLMLAALDQMLEEENLTYAEALWDHVTMDPEELGFRAGDLIRVTDCQDKHWWFGVLDDTEGWFPAAFVRLRVNQDLMDNDFNFLLSTANLSLNNYDPTNLHSNSINNNNNSRLFNSLKHNQEMREGRQQTSKSLLSSAPPSGGIGYLNKNHARANVVREIISAEREYVKHLRDVVEGYVKQARKRPEMFPGEKVTIIFSNIEEIYEFATELLASLEESIVHEEPHLSQLGQCFLACIKRFEMYSDYCNNHPAACEELRELYRNKRYRHFFEACRLLQEMIEIPLEGFLLTPVQKICKYHLQLAELLKFTPSTHPDHADTCAALEAMKSIATLINERKRKMESVEKLAAWQLLVDDWEGPDILESSSELIYSGELNKVNHAGWSQERYFFLFDHQLIYCKKDLLKKSSFVYKGRILMDACAVHDVADGRDPKYNVSVRNAWKLHDGTRDKWYLLVAKTAVAKQRWLKAFQDERNRVRDDAENNFNIPSHVKQAVVTNFKQKANLNKPKGRAKFNRTNSTQSFKTYSCDVDAIATLPRNKGRNKVKVKVEDDQVKVANGGNSSTTGGGGVGGKKINWFFLGKGKS